MFQKKRKALCLFWAMKERFFSTRMRRKSKNFARRGEKQEREEANNAKEREANFDGPA